jgi:hypothetical protein
MPRILAKAQERGRFSTKQRWNMFNLPPLPQPLPHEGGGEQAVSPAGGDGKKAPLVLRYDKHIHAIALGESIAAFHELLQQILAHTDD